MSGAQPIRATKAILDTMDWANGEFAYATDLLQMFVAKVPAGQPHGLGSVVLTAGFEADSYLSLTDTPASFVGKALEVVRVNAGETGLEFADSAGIGGTGTTNTLPKFTAATTVGDSNITDTGTLITSGVVHAIQTGTAALPGLTPTGDPNTGIFSLGADRFAVSTSGIQAMEWNASQQSLTITGTAAIPAVAFAADPDTGFFRDQADSFTIAAGGVSSATFRNQQVLHGGGTALLPSITFGTDPDTGIYLDAIGSQTFTSGGVQFLTLRPSQMFMPDGTAALPYVAFVLDPNTGLFRIGADNLGLSAGGVTRIDINTIRALFADDVHVTGKVGVGTLTPNATLDVTGASGTSVGGFPSGVLHVTSSGAGVNDNAVITGHNLNAGNKQLWYLGSTSSSNDNISFINRQAGSLSFNTSDTLRVTILAASNTLQGNAGMTLQGGSGVHTLTLSGGVSAASSISIGIVSELIGFFGASPVVRPTGVGVTTAQIHAALVSLGLITA